MQDMKKWAIVEGATGKLCIVPENMAAEHLTYGRKLCRYIACNGLLDAIDALRDYEKYMIAQQ